MLPLTLQFQNRDDIRQFIQNALANGYQPTYINSSDSDVTFVQNSNNTTVWSRILTYDPADNTDTLLVLGTLIKMKLQAGSTEIHRDTKLVITRRHGADSDIPYRTLIAKFPYDVWYGLSFVGDQDDQYKNQRLGLVFDTSSIPGIFVQVKPFEILEIWCQSGSSQQFNTADSRISIPVLKKSI
jgi:hypothetical protein